jgi:thiamine pyrophosphokinase
MEITFYDEFSSYFFIPKDFEINNVEGKMVSLLPFPKVENLVTDGLNWELKNEDLEITKRIGTRNFATKSTVKISYSDGDLLVFIGQ